MEKEVPGLSPSDERSFWILAGIIFFSWTSFAIGNVAKFHEIRMGRFASDSAILLSSIVVAALLIAIIWFYRKSWHPWLVDKLATHTDFMDSISDQRIGLWIMAAAGMGLFFELLIIRLHSSYFHIFATYKNISLLSCFLGLGIGYALGSRKLLLTPLVLPLLGLQIGIMHYLRYYSLDVHLANPVVEVTNMGLAVARQARSFLAVYGLLIFIFTFNVLVFIPFGQLASRLMSRRPNLQAYGWNLSGSLLGILLFTLVSFAWLPPLAWVLPVILFLMLTTRRSFLLMLISSLIGVFLVVLLGYSPKSRMKEIYSPYQIIEVRLPRAPDPLSIHVQANRSYFQKMHDLRPERVERNVDMRKIAAHYSLPYHLVPRPKDVLIVGAGTGNDVAAAVRNGAERIDAVEIDPAIVNLGEELHPERPYQSENVRAHVADARAFIRKTSKKYDLIVYGLLDSHSLLSGKSGVRLDSYVYTVEAFREARSRLKENGIMSITFCTMGRDLAVKLFRMITEAFDGKTPVVYETEYDYSTAFLNGDDLPESTGEPSSGLKNITSELAVDARRVDLSTDDWPFFYMPVRKYPITYVGLIVLLLVISVTLILRAVPDASKGFSVPCFFLGAGFMLLETKAITELALVYGTTWHVISIVITSIMVMAFLANLLAMKTKYPHPVIGYGLIIISVLSGLYLTATDSLSNTPLWISRLIFTIALTLPLFFSGLAFSNELKKAISIGVALASNLLGAMLGGFLEYNSMYFGYQFLYLLAIALYLCAFWGAMRGVPTLARSG